MYVRAEVYNVVVRRNGRVFGRFAVVAPNRREAHSVVQDWMDTGNFDGPMTYSMILARQGSGHSIFMPSTSATVS